MAEASDRIVLRSYRLAFELERRIHRIDRFRIPLPYGLPLGALGWGAAGFVGVLVLRQAPLAGPLLGLLPWPVQVVFIPGAAAHLLCRTTKDGRLVHEALLARALRRLRPERLIALARVPANPALVDAVWTTVTDERTDVPAPAVVVGPADVLICCRANAWVGRDELHLNAVDPDPLVTPREVVIGPKQRLVIER